MSSESLPATRTAVSVRNVSKSYRIFQKPQDRLKQVFLWNRRNLFREFWALHDINFDVQPGEAVGIIGANGAGKSSLLQIITGTTQPTSGEVIVDGRVAALLELGSGFNPEFTGRENVLMNAAILGLTREQIRDRYDEITAFADIGDFIDQPVKVYSTGMVVRLAFAVAVHVDADILIVDEALSVGDMQFQAKCISKINRFLQDPRKSLLFVSHSTDAVKSLCRKALLLHTGRQLAFGPAEQVCDEYVRLMRASSGAWNDDAPPANDAAGGASGVLTADDGAGGNGQARAATSGQWCFDMGGYQERRETLTSGALAPGRYRVRLRTARSRFGGIVTVRHFGVRRHTSRTTVPLSEIKASNGWQVLHAQTDDEGLCSRREDETLEFEFTGHELTFEAVRHSSGGAVELEIEPLPPPAPVPRRAVDWYRPCAEFERKVAALRMGTQQARLMNLELFDAQGRPTECVACGEDLIARLHLYTDIDLAYCNAGCVVRDDTGRDLLTVDVFDEQVNWEFWKAGTPRIVEARFKAAFRPGVYTVAAGVSHSIPVVDAVDERIFDFCPNAGVFKVTAEKSGRPCWGVVQLPATITVLS